MGEIADSRAAHLPLFCARRRHLLNFEKTKPASTGLPPWGLDWGDIEFRIHVERRYRTEGALKWMSRKCV